MLWEDLKEHEFDDAIEKSKGVCAIPMGCVEAHGQHMPLGCDVYQAREYTRRAAEKEPVCVFPSMHFGEKSGAGEFKGTIIFPQRLILDILLQSCKEIARNGFKKIIIINGHGGNNAIINVFARSILQKDYGFQVYIYNLELPQPKYMLREIEKYPYLTKEDIEVLTSYGDKRDGHGGFSETGILYDVVPHLIDIDKMNDVDGTSTGLYDDFSKLKIGTPFSWMASYPNSLGCDAHEGLNARIAKAMGERVTSQIQEVFAFLKNETVSEEYRKQWVEKNFR